MCFGADLQQLLQEGEASAGILWRAFGKRAELEAYAKRAAPFYKPIVACGTALAAAYKADPKFLTDGIDLYVAVSGMAFPGTQQAAPDISWIQRTLNTINHAGLKVDGKKGPATDAAIEAYQARKGIEVDSWVGPETFDLMTNDLKMQQGGK